MTRNLNDAQRIEAAILRDFHKRLWSPFTKAIRQYRLIRPGDSIAVCVSGGKDSMLLAKLMQLLCRHSEVPFTARYLVMDPGYSPENRRRIEENAALLDIPCEIFESDIFRVADAQEKNPCYLCARMRRGHLYAKAQALGCNKIALGHHFNDVIETTLLGMLYGAQLQAMPPRLNSTNFPGMELIRPLYMVKEEDIIAWRDACSLSFLQCACRMTERIGLSGRDAMPSKRQEVKLLLRDLKRTNPDVEKNVFNAIHAVQLDTFPGYKTGGQEHSFLERLEDN